MVRSCIPAVPPRCPDLVAPTADMQSEAAPRNSHSGYFCALHSYDPMNSLRSKQIFAWPLPVYAQISRIFLDQPTTPHRVYRPLHGIWLKLRHYIILWIRGRRRRSDFCGLSSPARRVPRAPTASRTLHRGRSRLRHPPALCRPPSPPLSSPRTSRSRTSGPGQSPRQI